ncbi:hypothetical protein P5W11_09790 [Mycobacteroides abscessus subsp. bolletii]|uniref:hypothetical protein n=1 Tax=Mycobacteroides abscessus TaxID=36809 RepID=UPI00266BB249|nr:hypothetical protein [Mycobacteroides abscessus]MDO3068503.1 hypothetical protein [Mycobacteroides abscessus subsp. bolletii]
MLFGREFPPGPPPPGIATPPKDRKFDVATELMITTALRIAERSAAQIESLAEEGKFPKRAAYMVSNAMARVQIEAALGVGTREAKEAINRFLMAGWEPPAKDATQSAPNGGAAND